MPIGNGYMGVSIFGGTESETLSISDKTMFNPSITGQRGAPATDPDGNENMRYVSVMLHNLIERLKQSDIKGSKFNKEQ